MLLHAGQRDAGRPGQLGDGCRATAEPLEDGPASWVSEGRKGPIDGLILNHMVQYSTDASVEHDAGGLDDGLLERSRGPAEAGPCLLARIARAAAELADDRADSRVEDGNRPHGEV